MGDVNTTLLDDLARYGPIGLAVAVFFGSLGVPVPITMLVLAAGALAKQGVLDGQVTLLLILAGAVLGDCTGYTLGRMGSRLVRYITGNGASGESRALWRQARARFERWGGVAIMLTRFLLTPLGPTTNVLAGTGGYAPGRFLLFDVAGELIWVLLYGGLGYLFADSWQALQMWTSDLTRALAILLVAGIALFLLLRQWRARLLRASGTIAWQPAPGTGELQRHVSFPMSRPDRWRDEVLRYLVQLTPFDQPAIVELSLPSQLGSEKLVRHTVAWLGQGLDFARERIADIQTAVSEACINAIEHGNQGRPRLRIKVVFTVTREHLEAVVVDQGIARYHEPEVPPPSVEQKLAGLALARGMGLMLIPQLVDEAGFLQDEPGQGNRFRLLIHRPQPGYPDLLALGPVGA